MASRIVFALVLVSVAAARVINDNHNNWNEYQNSKHTNYQEILESQIKESNRIHSNNQNIFETIPWSIETPKGAQLDITEISPYHQEANVLFDNNQNIFQISQDLLKTQQYQPPSNYIQEPEPKEHYLPAKYQFRYSVHDEKTGDIKAQEEARDGDKVKGRYSLVQPDGLRRIVEYYDDSHGFNAHVRYVPVH